MVNSFTTNELKEIYKHAMFSHFLSTEHEKKLFTLLNENIPPIQIELALEILTINPINCQKIITKFHTFPLQTQSLAAITLSSYQDNTVQTQLIHLLQSIKNEKILNLLTFSMGKSPYLNIIAILDNLDTDDKEFKKRLTALLDATPLKKFEIFIAASPELPHEALFRRIYGNEAINYLRGTSTNQQAPQHP